MTTTETVHMERLPNTQTNRVFEYCYRSPSFVLVTTTNCPQELFEGKEQIKNDQVKRNRNFLLHVEGVESLVKFNGPLNNILDQLTAGIRSGLSYSGAHNIQELWKKAKFIQVTKEGYQESLPHDVETI